MKSTSAECKADALTAIPPHQLPFEFGFCACAQAIEKKFILGEIREEKNLETSDFDVN